MFMLALAREGDGGDRILASLQFHMLVSNSYYVLSLSVGEGFQEVYYNSYMVGGSDVKLGFGTFLIKVTLTRVMRSMCGISSKRNHL